MVEGIIGQQMQVQATIVGHFVAAAEEAGWSAEEIEGRLRRIVDSTVIGEIRVVDPDGSVAYSNLLPPLAGGSAVGVPHVDQLVPLLDGSERSLELATAPRAADGEVYKYVAVAGAGSPRAVQVGIPIEGSAGNLLYAVYQREADLLVRSRNLEALWVVNLDRELAAAAPRAGQAGTGTVDAAGIFSRRAEAVVAQAMERGQVVSETSLSLLSPADRGIWVASPIINAGGIPIGGLTLAVSLDDIASTVQAEAFNTTLIAFVLLGFTAAAALWGTRWLTQPIEVIASAARQVEAGKQPDEGPLEDVIKRTDELGSLARVFEAMTVQVFNREEQLEMMVSARTEELQQSNRSLRVAQRALEQDLEMAKVVQAALVREGNANFGRFAAYARMTPAQQVGGDFVDVLEPSGGKLFFTVCDVSGKGVAAALFMAASQGAINAAATQSQNATSAPSLPRPTGGSAARIRWGCSSPACSASSTSSAASCSTSAPAMSLRFSWRANDSRRPLPMTDGVAMGVLDDFEYESRKEELHPGDALFLYTDGLTDAVNLGGELFGKERLETTLDGASSRSPEEIVDHVWSEILGYSAGAPAADDMTCLVLRRRR